MHKEICIPQSRGVEKETLPYLLLCGECRVRRKHGFDNKFWRRLKLLGLDLPFESPKPRVVLHSKAHGSARYGGQVPVILYA